MDDLAMVTRHTLHIAVTDPEYEVISDMMPKGYEYTGTLLVGDTWYHTCRGGRRKRIRRTAASVGWPPEQSEN